MSMGRTKKPTDGPLRVAGYVRVSTSEQADSGLGLEAQKSAIRSEVDRRGWELLTIHEDAGWSGKSLNRPGLSDAMASLKAGEVSALLVSKLDRASRSLVDFAGLLVRAERERWKFVALDLGIDTSSPSGELIASVMAAVAQWERRAIGARTKEALAIKKAQGVLLGRPQVLPAEVVTRVVAERHARRTLQAIATGLNVDQVPTGHGGSQWWPSTVAKILAGARAAS